MEFPREEGTKAYHDELKKAGIVPKKGLKEDLEITERSLTALLDPALLGPIRRNSRAGKHAMGRSRRGFVTGGCWCVDRNRTIPFWPKEDMSVSTSAPIMRGGGSACNFAIDIRRLDPQMWVETIGLVGDDQEGRFLQSRGDEVRN